MTTCAMSQYLLQAATLLPHGHKLVMFGQQSLGPCPTALLHRADDLTFQLNLAALIKTIPHRAREHRLVMVGNGSADFKKPGSRRIRRRDSLTDNIKATAFDTHTPLPKRLTITGQTMRHENQHSLLTFG